MNITLLLALRDYITYAMEEESNKSNAKCIVGRKLIKELDKEIKKYA